MLRRAALVSAACVLGLTACGVRPTRSAGTWVPDYYGFGLTTHDQWAHVIAIWHHELRRQPVRHLDAVVYFAVRPKRNATVPGSKTCPSGPLTRIIIKGSFPAQPPTVKYEDLYATMKGRVCHVAYRRSVPYLPEEAAEHLHRVYDVPNSS